MYFDTSQSLHPGLSIKIKLILNHIKFLSFSIELLLFSKCLQLNRNSQKQEKYPNNATYITLSNALLDRYWKIKLLLTKLSFPFNLKISFIFIIYP